MQTPEPRQQAAHIPAVPFSSVSTAQVTVGLQLSELLKSLSPQFTVESPRRTLSPMMLFS